MNEIELKQFIEDLKKFLDEHNVSIKTVYSAHFQQTFKLIKGKDFVLPLEDLPAELL